MSGYRCDGCRHTGAESFISEDGAVFYLCLICQMCLVPIAISHLKGDAVMTLVRLLKAARKGAGPPGP